MCGVPTEPIDVLGQVRPDARQILRLDRPALLQQLADGLGEDQGVVGNVRVLQEQYDGLCRHR